MSRDFLQQFQRQGEKRAEWEQSKWICLSSLLFLTPAWYAYLLGYYHYTCLFSLVTAVSINYWRKPEYSWRRTSDYVLATTSATWITYNAIVYVRHPPLVLSFWSLYIVLLYCNHMSGVHLDKKEPHWWKYHFVCHIIENYGCCVVLYSF